MPRKPSKAEAAAGQIGATAAGPAMMDPVGEALSPAEPNLSNEEHLAQEKAANETRAREAFRKTEAAQRLFGKDADDEKPSFDPLAKKHKPQREKPGLEDHQDDPLEDGLDDAGEDAVEAAAQPDEDAGDADDGEGTSEPEVDPDLEAALKALRLDYGEDASILTKGLDPEEIKLLGKRARLRQRDFNQRLQEKTELQRTNGNHATAAEAAKASSPPVVSEEWTGRLKRLGESIGLDDGATGELGDLIRSAALEMATPLKEAVVRTGNLVADMVEKDARARLGRDLPVLLKDAKLWSRVVQGARRILKDPDFDGTIESAFEDSANLATNFGLSTARRQSTSQTRRRQSAGQPTSPSQRNVTRAPQMSQDQVERRIFDLVEAGKHDEARALRMRHPHR